MINVAPKTSIDLVGTLDFDLLGPGVGKGCAGDGDDTIYWVGMNDLAALGPDRLSRRAIAAAALDAVSRLEDADTILITSVETEGKDGRVCAKLHGRGVRLVKAGAAHGSRDDLKTSDRQD